jgi:hypothetical protein
LAAWTLVKWIPLNLRLELRDDSVRIASGKGLVDKLCTSEIA